MNLGKFSLYLHLVIYQYTHGSGLGSIMSKMKGINCVYCRNGEAKNFQLLQIWVLHVISERFLVMCRLIFRNLTKFSFTRGGAGTRFRPPQKKQSWHVWNPHLTDGPKQTQKSQHSTHSRKKGHRILGIFKLHTRLFSGLNLHNGITLQVFVTTSFNLDKRVGLHWVGWQQNKTFVTTTAWILKKRWMASQGKGVGWKRHGWK